MSNPASQPTVLWPRELERSSGDTEMHSNRPRGNDWDSTEGRKEGEGRASFTGHGTLVSHRKQVWASAGSGYVQRRAGTRLALTLALARSESKVKVIKARGLNFRLQPHFPKGLL